MLRALMGTFRFDSPLGALIISADQDVVRSLVIDDGAGAAHPLLGPGALRTALETFFAGGLTALDRIRVVKSGSLLAQATYRALRAIPAGQTRSYAEIAAALGRPRAAQPVARACANNPVALLIPCHRAIGTDGGLRGYVYGLERKRWLLEHERRWAIRPSSSSRPHRSDDSSSIAHSPLG